MSLRYPLRHDHIFCCSLEITQSQVEPGKSLGTEMDFSMKHTAKGYEIFFHIAPQKASLLHAMDLEIFGTPASLASPAITLEHLLTKPPIGIPVQAKPGWS